MKIRSEPDRTACLRFGLILAATCWIVLSSGIASAQQESTPVQLAGELSALGLDCASGDGTGLPGLGVRVDLRLTRRVEIEGRLTWFPETALQEFQAQGGRTLQVAAGVRGKLFTSRRASVYGLLLPGLLHFTDTATGVAGDSLITGGSTHFALDTGLGIEFYPTSRWTVRGEVSGPVYGAPGTELGRSSPGADGSVLVLSAEARFVSPWQVSTAVGYRFGPLQHERVEESVTGRWEVGGHVSQVTSTDAYGTSDTFQQNPGLGVFVSCRLAAGVYADAALNAFLRSAIDRTPFDGGRELQGLAGVKLGLRKDRYGIFVAERVGVNSHSSALAAVNTSPPFSVTTRRSNAVAIDLSGVVERYIGRRLLVRFDGGDVLSVFRATTLIVNGVPTPQPLPNPMHSLQLTAGVGWRF